ncbi:MAG: hypothetical protein GXP49_11845 [Deltaproteobacteria bacterium]|nr:hypothetical protein [Deltaproteobacteria bacterium]
MRPGLVNVAEKEAALKGIGFFFGPIKVKLDTRDMAPARYYSWKYRDFLCSATADAAIHVSVCNDSKDPCGQEKQAALQENEILEIFDGPGFKTKIVSIRGVVQVTAIGPACLEGSNLGLQYAASHVYSEKSGLLIHGALIESQGKGLLLAGPSGAGKTTLAGILGERAYCDELCMVQRQQPLWKVWSTALQNGRKACFDLTATILLQRGQVLSLSRASSREAVKGISSQIIVPRDGPGRISGWSTALDLALSVPCYKLIHGPSLPAAAELEELLANVRGAVK